MDSADKASQKISSTHRVYNQHRYLNVFLISVVVTALLVGPTIVLGLIIPSFASQVVILVLFLVALESGLTTWWLANRDRRFNRLAYRVAEVLIIIVLVRLISWWIAGQSLYNLAFRTYLIRPAEILDPNFVIFTFTALFAWDRSMAFTSIFRKLALDSAEITYYSTPTAERFKSKISTVIPKNRILLYRDYLRAWLTGGIILVVFVVISTFDLPRATLNLQNDVGLFGFGRLPLSPQMLIALMAYFLGGLWLASLGRLHVLQARWLMDGSKPDESIVRLWQRRSVLALLIVALLSASLPIGSSLAISRILSAVVLYVTYFVSGLWALIIYLLYSFFSLFSNESPPAVRQPLILDEFARDSTATAEQSEIASLIFGGIFWLAIGLIVVFALIFFLRERGISIGELGTPDRLVKKILKWIQQLIVSFRETAGRVTSSLEIPIRYQFFASKDIQNPWPFFRINSLSPRDQIRFFYLAAVKKARQKGIRRSPGTTADEFSKYLIAEWPDSEVDVRKVTEAFQIARYSQKDLKRRDLPPIREAYKKLRREQSKR